MKPHHSLIALISRLVPRRFRSDWKQEWDAELLHREARSGQRDLTRRSLGAFWDALAMQPRRLEEEIFQDLRYGLRMLLQNKGWSLVAVVSLALGIGANTALFSVYSSVLLRSLPVNDAGQLVAFKWAGGGGLINHLSGYGAVPADTGATFSYPAFQNFSHRNRTLDGIAAIRPMQVNFVAGGQAQMASAHFVSGNYYDVLQVPAVLGRTLTEADDRQAAAPAVVISDRFWQRRFAKDPAAVGSVASINGMAFTIVGVTGPSFYGTIRLGDIAPDLSIPLVLEGQFEKKGSRLNDATDWWLLVIGRATRGVSASQVQADLQDAFHETELDSFSSKIAPDKASAPRFPQLRVVPGARGIYDPEPGQLRQVSILMSIVGLVLLVVCANVANLLLARASTRQKEITVRLALGATRLRLVRQVLTESILLSGIGGVLGMGIGYIGSRFVPLWTGDPQPLDWRVVGFTGVITIVTGLVFGLAPALRSSRSDLGLSLKESDRRIIRSKSLFTKSLLVAQMSACLFLLVGSGLLLQTLRNLYSIDVGFNTQHVLLFRIDPEANGYLGNRFTAVNEQIVERLEAIPGVKSVSLSSKALLNGGRNRSGIEIAGRNAEPGHPESVSRMTVRHSFFETMQIPIVKGRALAAGDNQNAPDVAVINEAFAKKFFPNAEPIGNRFGFGFRNRSEIEIVGVVRDAKNSQIRETVEPAIYLSYLQNPTDGPVTDPPTYELRTVGDPLSAVGAVRNAIREVDRNLPLIDVRTQSDEVDKRLSQERLLAFSSTAFGGLTLILASTGLFGLMSYSVARRRNEIGIRMAVGARRSDMIMMVMRETLTLAGIGTLLGLIGIVALSRLLETMVFGLAPTDPTIITGATILMLAVAVAAGYLPARRASRVDPMIALRHE